jgi:ubiquinone/menaquinone biosynthesis C-methylase UbiE
MYQHQQQIVNQFTRQAATFAESPEINDEAALTLAIQFAGLISSDEVLDVACGPGVLACACAPFSRHVTGIDITPAMIDLAKELQARKKLDNLAWQTGDVRSLPFSEDRFDVVMCRYSFHHILDPFVALVEMKRVCKPSGRLMVIDVAAPADTKRARALNDMERVRDPSHVRALAATELADLFTRAGVTAPQLTSYRLEFELESVLAGSFPLDGDADKNWIRQRFNESLENDSMGLNCRLMNDEIRYSYPIVVLRASKER